MVVTDENHADGGHARPVDAAAVASGDRVMLGSEGQSSPAVEIDSELTRAIVRQGTGASGNQFRDPERRVKIGEALSRSVLAEGSNGLSLLQTQLLQLPVVEQDNHVAPSSANTINQIGS
jgi:hypothetical protein